VNVFDELFTIDDLEHEVDGGYLSVDHHPIHRAILLNYTSKAVFERRWNPVTTQCRGLIIDEEGNLLVIALMSNVGQQRSAPLDLIAVVLNDCILPNVPQTCRFVAFGRFPDVTPEGIGPNETVQWTFDFGPYPEVDLSRWSIIWYQVR